MGVYSRTLSSHWLNQTHIQIESSHWLNQIQIQIESMCVDKKSVNLPMKECRQHFSKYRKEMLANPTSFRKLKTKRRSRTFV